MSKQPAKKPSVKVALLPSLSVQISIGIVCVGLVIASIFALNQDTATSQTLVAACDTGDCDNDGLINEKDWDDDGDGIPDIAEGICRVASFDLDFQSLDNSTDPVADINNANLQLGNAILSMSAITTSGNATLDDYEISDGHIAGVFGPKIGVLSSSSSNDYIRIHFEFSESVHQLEFDIHDIDQRDALQVNASRGGSTYSLMASEYTTPACVSYIGNNVFESICNTAVNGTTDGSIHLNFAEAVDELEILLFQSSGPDGGSISLGSFTAACADRDTDQDGLPDFQDQDSDNDGITDKTENQCGEDPTQSIFAPLAGSTDPVQDINNANLVVGGSRLTLNPISFGGTGAIDEYSIDNTHYSGAVGVKLGVLNSNSAADYLQATYVFADPIGSLCFLAVDLDQNDAIQVNAKYKGQTLSLDELNATYPHNAPCPQWQGNNTWYSSCNFNTNNSIQGGIQICIPDSIDELEIRYYDYAGTNGGSFTIANLYGCGLIDSDGDGYANQIDLDADNDGIPDLVEAGGADTNGDGMTDLLNADGSLGNDWDGDGLDDRFDAIDSYVAGSPGWSVGSLLTETDMDQDGLPNYLDLDSDEDGIPDIIEAGGIDTDGNGLVDAINAQGLLTDDRDNDGFDDRYDTDDNGVPGIDQNTGAMMLPSDANNDGRADAYPAFDNDANSASPLVSGDADGDGIPNFLDLDADNDGIPDLVEVGGLDTNGDGQLDAPSATLIFTQYSLSAGNPALPDYSGSPSLLGGTNVDFDQDGIPNYLDLDADNDGISDVVEVWTQSVDLDQNARVDGQAATDANQDGWHDAYLGQIPTSADASTSEFTNNNAPDFQTGDTKADYDGDGLPNYLDLDADNDGILDLIEAQSSSLNPTDIFAGLQMPASTDADYDGLTQAYDLDEAGSYVLPKNHENADNPDFLDTDTDNDGVVDLMEGHDGDLNGLVDNTPSANDIDFDGLDDAFDTQTTSPNPTASNQSIQDADGDLNTGGDRDWRDLNSTSFPVEWLSFSVSLDGEDGQLSWATASETNSDFYLVERSVDSKVFERLGKVEAAGNSTSQSDYAFTDLGVLKSGHSKVYYRLKQVDQDGTADFSPVVALSLHGLDQLFEIEAYPNPATKVVNFSYLQAKAGDLEIAVFDTQGKLIWRRRLTQAFTKGEINLNISNWASGTYLVRMSNETASNDFRWIKQ
ncbi:MAG: T9SS type A sorting domain-containing protein [Bacteroidota bacterium]